MMYEKLEQKVRRFISKAYNLVLDKEVNTTTSMARIEERGIVNLLSESARRVNPQKQGIYGNNDVRVKKLKPYPGSTAHTKVQAGSMEYDLSFLCSSKQTHVIIGIQGYIDMHGPQKIFFDLVERGLSERGYKKERISGDFIRYEKTLET